MISTHGHQNTEADVPAAVESEAAASEAAGSESTEATDSAESAESVAAAKPRKRRIGILLAVALLAYLLDLGSKLLVVAKLEHQNAIQLIGDWVQLDVIRNAGAAFGMGQAMTIVFTLIAATVIVVIIRLARKLYSLPWAVALGLLLGGAFGNLTDRIFRSPGLFRGEVVDFISVKHFAVFNLADSAIVCGGILVVLLSFLGTNPDGSVQRDK
ncbi:signal peptidase II [Streptacidiphilus sp. MAP5-3]|uniref:signal peptidase II n=1 Tax=unclassified Streptacidiphilus TaxID=2643834 RepID=UPI0035113358